MSEKKLTVIEKRKQKQREYYQKPEVIERRKKWQQEYNQRPEVIERRKKRDKENYKKLTKEEKIKRLNWQKEYNKRPYVKEKIRKKTKEYYQKNKEKILKANKEYCQKPEVKKRMLIKDREYRTNKYHNNIQYHLKELLRSRVGSALKNNFKSKKTLELIGCSIEDLKKHLENQFTPGMNWKNHSFYGWHIDHIVPCSKFDLNKEEEQKKCFHYTNLQPLWMEDNISKLDKVLI